MYNSHRGMVPPPAQATPNRLNDLLEQIRQEFEQSSGRAIEYEGQRMSSFTLGRGWLYCTNLSLFNRERPI